MKTRKTTWLAGAVAALFLAACADQMPTDTGVTDDGSASLSTTAGEAVPQPAGKAMASNLGDPVPADKIVSHNGLQWVWASPCAVGGCTSGIDVGHDGFEYATDDQWAARPPVEAFLDADGKNICASPWFDHTHDHCDWVNLVDGPEFNNNAYGSAPVGGLPTSRGTPMEWYFETLLVRVGNPQTKDDCKDGGWEQYGFKNQGQCVRFIETGKDSR